VNENIGGYMFIYDYKLLLSLGGIAFMVGMGVFIMVMLKSKIE
jgi:hypothetical protein